MKKCLTWLVTGALTVLFSAGVLYAVADENDGVPERTVLLEQFTRQSCGACPGRMRDVAEQTADYNVVTLSYHSYDEMSTPETDAFIEQFTTAAPTFFVDRSLDGLNSIAQRISGTVRTRSFLPPEMSIMVDHGYDSTTRRVVLNLTFQALADIEKGCRINVILKEDRLCYEQGYEGKMVYPYYHSDVVREFITGPKGELFNDAVIPKDTVIDTSYSFTLDERYVSDFCEIAVFVNRDLSAGIGPLLQAAEVSLYNAQPIHVADKDPLSFKLTPAYPNPFNPVTTIVYDLPSPCHVKLIVYDMLGRMVRVLDDCRMGAGRHEAVWGGRDFRDNDVASGVYFYRITAGNAIRSGKMMLIK